MTQTPGNTISGAGAYGPGVLRPPVSHMWMFETVALLGAGALSLTVAGRLARPVLVLASQAQLGARALVVATSPVNWALYNIYREAGDFAHWARGGEMELGISITGRPWTSPGGTLIVPFPWLDIQPSHSSGGGGPGGLPNLHRPPPSIEETGKSLSDPPLVGQLKDWARSKVRSDGRCRTYYRGDTHHRYPVPVRCSKKAGHRGKHRYGRFTWKG